MDIQVGDVWAEDGYLWEVICNNFTNPRETCCKVTNTGTGKTWGSITTNTKDFTDSFKLISRIVDGERIDRPKAGELCNLQECLVFGIGTEVEYNMAVKEAGTYPRLDDNGELPKREPKQEDKGYVDCPVEDYLNCYFFEYHNGRTHTIEYAQNCTDFMGYVWDEGGKEMLYNDCVMWRDEDGDLWNKSREDSTLELCKAVRFKK